MLAKITEQEGKCCVVDHLHQTAFLGTSLARNVQGSAASVAKINEDRLIDFSKANYTGGRIVVSAAGDIDQGKLVDLSEKTIGALAVSRPASSTAHKRSGPGYIHRY